MLTLTENGTPLTETYEGLTMPADYRFETINDFVHRHDTNYEDLQYICLGMASHIEKLEGKTLYKVVKTAENKVLIELQQES